MFKNEKRKKQKYKEGDILPLKLVDETMALEKLLLMLQKEESRKNFIKQELWLSTILWGLL